LDPKSLSQLRELLPEAVPETRIYTWGYEVTYLKNIYSIPANHEYMTRSPDSLDIGFIRAVIVLKRWTGDIKER
jgi:hypothetical protein